MISPARAARSLEYRLLDALDVLTRRADPLVPPRRAVFVGPGDFRRVGDQLLGLLVDEAGLRPDERVLDIGCGIGRLARPLAGYLAEDGAYAGFDVVPDGIEFCRERFTPRFPRFRFELTDVANGTYNPGGAAEAASFRFPYDDASFDLAAATSLFTHLTGPAAANYLREAARVLAPGGRLLATFFVRDAAAEAAMADGRTAHAFPHGLGDGVWAADPDEPEAAVAFEPRWLERELERAGLSAAAALPGAWRGGAGATHQDVVVASR